MDMWKTIGLAMTKKKQQRITNQQPTTETMEATKSDTYIVAA